MISDSCPKWRTRMDSWLLLQNQPGTSKGKYGFWEVNKKRKRRRKKGRKEEEKGKKGRNGGRGGGRRERTTPEET